MFGPALRSALLIVALSVLSVSAIRSLSLSVVGLSDVFDVVNLKVITALTNDGDETLQLLNDPRSVLSRAATNSFTISNAAGSSPVFKGINVKYVPSYVTKKNSSSSFTVLAPSQTVEVEHDLSIGYNFTTSGEGVFDITASSLFHYMDTDTQEAIPIYASHISAHTTSLRGRLAVDRRDTGFTTRSDSRLLRRIDYQNCSSSERSALVSAAAAAQTYATAAQSYLNSNTASTARFVTWFGTYSSAHHSTVFTHYANMVAHPYASYTYNCNCTDKDTFAFVYPDQFGTIYLCGAFWAASTTGTDSRGGTLVHESSHFLSIGGTQDYVYGQTASKSLAKANSAEAIANADSHEYFAENNPVQS